MGENFDQKGPTPRFWLGAEVTGLLYKRRIEGMHNLELIPKDRPVVFAVNHISDADIPGAMSFLGPRYNLGIGYISALLDDPKLKPILEKEFQFLGKSNFFPIDFMAGTTSKEPWVANALNIDNFLAMNEAMRRGKAMLMAAHKPTYNLILPPRAGYAPAILANMAHATIVPIAINLHEEAGNKSGAIEELAKKPLSRRPMDINIGEPMSLEPCLNVYPLTREVLPKLREQSGMVMRAIARMLPREKRGIWIT